MSNPSNGEIQMISSAADFLEKGEYPMKNQDRVAQGFALAAWLHQDQSRKVGDNEDPALAISYMTHLAEVFALVIQGFGDDDQMIAGLLHDAIEDQNPAPDGSDTEQLIREQFGERVLEMVLANTDSKRIAGQAKEAWLPRKQKHIAHIREIGAKDPALLLVGVADKLSNGQAIVNDIETHGEIVWSRFKQPTPDQIAWYYESMLAVFQELIPTNPLVGRLEIVAEQIRAKANEVTGTQAK